MAAVPVTSGPGFAGVPRVAGVPGVPAAPAESQLPPRAGRSTILRRRGARAGRTAAVALGKPDYQLLIVVIGLLAFGLIMVYSSSVVTAYTAYRNQFYFLLKQGFSALIGLVLLLVAMRVDYHYWRSFSVLGLVGSIVLLAAVLVPGIGAEVYGASRWISLGSFQLQPSELSKLALILYISHWLTTKREQVANFTYGLVPFSLLMGVIVALLMRQPDMGTTIVTVGTAFAIFFAAGASLLHVGLLSGIGAFGFAGLIVVAPYRMQRLMAFLNPWENQLGNSYHVVQSLLAFGAGGITGVGLGVGRQKFMYLPFPHTDSIFAVVGEELGLIGTVAILAAFVFFTYRGLHIAWYAPDQFGRLLAVGVTCGIAIQALLNIAVLTSSVPFTGITLPFISYGGSSLITTLAGCGVLLNVSRQIVPTSRNSGGHAGSSGGAGAPSALPGAGSRGGRRYSRPHLPGFGRRPRAAHA